MIDIFQYPDIKFPEGFLIGASTAGQQIEGNSFSQYDLPGFRADDERYQRAGLACRSYEFYEKDVELIRTLGLNAYRMSVEWSRIEPEKGVFSKEATDHYIHQLAMLKESGIKVCLTLLHFAYPAWLHKLGHFTNLNQMNLWRRYVEYIVPKVEPYVDYWITINELNLPYHYPVSERLVLLEYHAAAYHIIKKYSNKPAAAALAYSMKMPYRGQEDKLDNLLAAYMDYEENEFFLHAIRTGEICAPGFESKYVPDLKDSCDYWAFNTYSRSIADGRKADWLHEHPTYNATHIRGIQFPFYTDEIYPDIMVNALLRMRDKPCMITENGMATSDDRFRIVYISAMLQAIREAMDMGVEVLGYLYWSLLDNWEWGTNIPTFGIARADNETGERIIKDSGRFLGDICRQGGYSKALAEKYLKGMPSKLDLSK